VTGEALHITQRKLRKANAAETLAPQKCESQGVFYSRFPEWKAVFHGAVSY
jgi:hypothetical protein